MCGVTDGVSTKIAKDVDHLFWLHCTSHCLNLIMENACKNVISDTATLVKEISNTFLSRMLIMLISV